MTGPGTCVDTGALWEPVPVSTRDGPTCHLGLFKVATQNHVSYKTFHRPVPNGSLTEQSPLALSPLALWRVRSGSLAAP